MNNMKKILILLTLVLALAACSDAVAKLSNPSEKVLQIGETTITKDQVFQFMISGDTSTVVINMAKNVIRNARVEVTDEVREMAQKDLVLMKDILKDDFLLGLKSIGYTSEEDYLERALIPLAQQNVMMKTYIEENLDFVVATYYPRRARIIEFAVEADAKEVLAAIKAGGNTEELGKANTTSLDFFGQLATYHRDSNIPTTVKTFLKDSNGPALTQELISVNSKFYIVEVIEAVPARFQEELITSLSAVSSLIDTMWLAEFKDSGFKIFDINVYNAIKNGNQSKFLPSR
jgi:foldase protein PrsA